MNKLHKCKYCNNTDPSNFYQGYKGLCKSCRNNKFIEKNYDKMKKKRYEIKNNFTYHCDICGFNSYSEALLRTHLSTKKHKKNISNN